MPVPVESVWNVQPAVPVRVRVCTQNSTVPEAPEALMLLSRDVERVCQYFAKQGIAANATQIACDLWKRFVRGQL